MARVVDPFATGGIGSPVPQHQALNPDPDAAATPPEGVVRCGHLEEHAIMTVHGARAEAGSNIRAVEVNIGALRGGVNIHTPTTSHTMGPLRGTRLAAGRARTRELPHAGFFTITGDRW